MSEYMPNRRPDILSLTPVPIPVARGVYAEQIEPNDDTVYYAITSTGQLLNGELRRRMPDETEATVVREMWRDLNRQDPGGPTPPRLALVP
jgi:hypothetical protein